MRGRVKNINESKEFGFILGEDAQEYFFHFNNVKSVDLPSKNSIVNFKVSSSNKGLIAVDVILESKKSKMIKIGEDRIDVNEIKAYGKRYYCGERKSPNCIWDVWIDTYNGSEYIGFRGTSYECDKIIKKIDESLDI